MLSETRPDPERTLSHAHMREIVNHALSRGFTGMATISFLMGEELNLLIQAGEIRDVLLQENRQKRRLPGAKYQDADFFEASRMGFLRLQKTPGRFLQCERACFDAKEQETRKGNENQNLGAVFLELEKRESATVVALCWQGAKAYVLVPGSNIPMRRAVFIHGSQIEVDDFALSVMAYWRESHCELTTYQGALETDAWIALHLNILFEYVCANMLSQYGYLTGRVMVNSLVRSMTYLAPQYRCDLSGEASQVQDQTLFTSLDETAAAYKGLSAFLDAQMEAVVGPNFIKSAKKQAFDSLNPFYANLARFYGLTF